MKPLLLTLIATTVALAAEADFGLVTLGASDTARLTAFCVPPPGNDRGVMPPCLVTLEFHDIGGATLNTTTLTLQPGTGGYLDQPASVDRPNAIVPCIKVLRGPAQATLEIFDSFSQRTRILAVNPPDGDRGANDPPEPVRGDVDFGLAGITSSDRGRLGVLCASDGSRSCDVTLEFHDAQGNTLKSARMMLAPGMGGVLDILWSEIGTRTPRGEIQPCFKVADGAAIGTFEVLDSSTSAPLAHMSPAPVLR